VRVRVQRRGGRRVALNLQPLRNNHRVRRQPPGPELFRLGNADMCAGFRDAHFLRLGLPQLGNVGICLCFAVEELRVLVARLADEQLPLHAQFLCRSEDLAEPVALQFAAKEPIRASSKQHLTQAGNTTVTA
jgi:hypothetical protein